MSPTTQVPETTTVGIAGSGTPMPFTEVSPRKVLASIETLVPGRTRIFTSPTKTEQLISTTGASNVASVRSSSTDPTNAFACVCCRIRHGPTRLLSLNIAVRRSDSCAGPDRVDGRGRRRRDRDQVGGQLLQLVERLGRQRGGGALIVLGVADPALRVRGLQQLGHLLAIGVGRAHGVGAHLFFCSAGLRAAHGDAAEQRHALDHQGRRAGQRVADVADVGAAEDAGGLVAHLDAFRHLDVEAAEAPEAGDLHDRALEDRIPEVEVDAAEQGECLAVFADPPLAGAGDAAEDRDQLVGLVGGPGRVDGERLLRVGAGAIMAGVPTTTRSRVIGIRSSKVRAASSWSSRSSCSSRVSRPSAYAVLKTVATCSRSASEARRFPPAMGPTLLGSGTRSLMPPR